MTLRWISISTTWRRSASTVAAIPVPQRPQAQVPVNGMIPHWSGVIDQGASDTASARLSTWFAPAGLALRAWWRLLERKV